MSHVCVSVMLAHKNSFLRVSYVYKQIPCLQESVLHGEDLRALITQGIVGIADKRPSIHCVLVENIPPPNDTERITGIRCVRALS